MKKNYFMLVCLMLFMALQATAQNFTIDQLYGKWQFTADVEFTADATQAHKETLSGDCEAVISADETYIARIALQKSLVLPVHQFSRTLTRLVQRMVRIWLRLTI